MHFAKTVKLPTSGDQVDEVEQLVKIRTVREIASLPDSAASKMQNMASDAVPENLLKFENPDYKDTTKSLLDQEIKEIVKAKPDRPKPKAEKPVEISEREVFNEYKVGGDNPTVVNQVKQRETREDLVEDTDMSEGVELKRPEDVLTGQEIPEEFFDIMPGFTPQLAGETYTTPKAAANQDIMAVEAKKDFTTTVRREGQLDDLKQYLVSRIETHQPPGGSDKFFKITLKVGPDAKELVTIPKEIIFLVDSSFSIKEKRLDEFKKGLEFSLKNLNPEDFFNIVAFKDTREKFQPQSVKATGNMIDQALKFVDNLSAGSKTDTYKALLDTVNEQTTELSSYIIFFSDGRPTKGERDSQKIINMISNLNSAKTSIFAFSGGLRVNRYLLDFISYKNRGWTEYSHRSNLIGRYMSEMYTKIKDPILLHMRYNTAGLDTEEMFPKMLPDFFKGAEFTIYGKYSDEDQFSLQLIGESSQETGEFIIDANLGDGLEGGEDIAKNWAFNKIYHLIGQITDDNDNTAALSEIQSLSQKFNIKTPYLENIR